MINNVNLDVMRRYARDHLSVDRYRHSLGVMVAMERAAALYGLNPLKAAMAGILHDLAKELPDEHLVALLAQHDPGELKALEEVGCLHNIYLHGPVAVPIIQCELGLNDPMVLDAVRKHAGNYEEMSLLARVQHVADMTAPTVLFTGIRKLHLLFTQGRLDEAELLLDAWILEVNAEKGIPIHPSYHRRIQMLTELVNPAPDFFSRDDPPAPSSHPPEL